MKLDALTIDEFFIKAGIYSADLEQLDILIQKHLPNVDRKLVISDTICLLGYGFMNYKTTTYEDVLPIISIAPQKNNISIYVMAVQNGKYLTETYASQLGKVSCGKSCIRIKSFSKLNIDIFIKLLNDVYKIYNQIV